MVDYNHEWWTDKAMAVGDLCWTLLDYGQAVAEGAALGAYSAAHDLITNPVNTVVCMVANKPILLYQLSKVLYNVADISVTALVDNKKAQRKWNTYTEPLNNIINAINKKEITLRDAIKSGTAFAVGWQTQVKLLGGLGKFCNTIQQKSLNFIKNNSRLKPVKYLTTPEGLLFKASISDSSNSTIEKFKNNLLIVNQASLAVLKDGYYEVNGFKFTQYYYEYLWNNGRGGPSLTAKTILENATTIIPDPQKHSGFFKYLTSGWEMIYNPTTKIVAHMQPNPKLK